MLIEYFNYNRALNERQISSGPIIKSDFCVKLYEIVLQQKQQQQQQQNWSLKK